MGNVGLTVEVVFRKLYRIKKTPLCVDYYVAKKNVYLDEIKHIFQICTESAIDPARLRKEPCLLWL